MGCDIHLKLEYRKKNPKPTDYEYEKKWRTSSLTYSECFSERVYSVFAYLADVRNYDGVDTLEIRGFPEDASENTIMAYSALIVPDDEYESRFKYDDKPIIRESEANELINKYHYKTAKIWNRDFLMSYDVHSPNWCTTDEMAYVVKKVFYNKKKKKWKGAYENWLALVGAMKAYEKTGEYECRAVFWFDS